MGLRLVSIITAKLSILLSSLVGYLLTFVSLITSSLTHLSEMTIISSKVKARWFFKNKKSFLVGFFRLFPSPFIFLLLLIVCRALPTAWLCPLDSKPTREFTIKFCLVFLDLGGITADLVFKEVCYLTPQWSCQNVDAQKSPWARCHFVVGWM